MDSAAPPVPFEAAFQYHPGTAGTEIEASS